MQRVLIMYNLKPGINIEEYKKWSREVDQTTTPFQPGVWRFEVFEIKGSNKEKAPFQIVEVVEVESYSQWEKAVAGEGMKKVVQDWAKFGDESSLFVVYGDKIK